jgi:hypothetical protein
MRGKACIIQWTRRRTKAYVRRWIDGKIDRRIDASISHRTQSQSTII